MLHHKHAVARRNGNCPPGAAFTDNQRNQGHAKPHAAIGGTRDGFRLAPLFRVNARIGPRRIHKCDHRNAKAFGQLHESHGLAVALRPRHAKIMLEARLCIGPFFLADHHNRRPPKPSKPADNGIVLSEFPVPCHGHKIGNQPVNISQRMGPFLMPRHQGFLPWRQIGIEIRKDF